MDLRRDQLIARLIRERRKGQRYGSELRRQAVERMNACGNIVGLARELGVSRIVRSISGPTDWNRPVPRPGGGLHRSNRSKIQWLAGVVCA